MTRNKIFVAGHGLLLVLLLTLISPAAVGKTEEAKAKSTENESSQYVGSDTCQGCHEDIYKKGFSSTPHYKTTLQKGHGCESCHGPGAAHVEGGGDKTKIFSFKDKSASEISHRCMECHEYGAEHANFNRSQHNINDVSCIACHSTHQAKEPQFLLVEKQPQLCFGCHTDAKQDFSRPFRHRVEQGLVSCTDCHNQHGSSQTTLLRATASQDQVCFKCHADKAGPFAFEHEPLKTEGCSACHQPHGSTNPRLLKRSQINLLCLECHTLTVDSAAPAIPSFHNQSQKYQACTLCHVTVHGSNFDRMLFK
jgi:DmsE family decaheme c-type cytochrome